MVGCLISSGMLTFFLGGISLDQLGEHIVNFANLTGRYPQEISLGFPYHTATVPKNTYCWLVISHLILIICRSYWDHHKLLCIYMYTWYHHMLLYIIYLHILYYIFTYDSYPSKNVNPGFINPERLFNLGDII